VFACDSKHCANIRAHVRLADHAGNVLYDDVSWVVANLQTNAADILMLFSLHIPCAACSEENYGQYPVGAPISNAATFREASCTLVLHCASVSTGWVYQRMGFRQERRNYCLMAGMEYHTLGNRACQQLSERDLGKERCNGDLVVLEPVAVCFSNGTLLRVLWSDRRSAGVVRIVRAKIRKDTYSGYP
jgi:hypothetical protein